jgi:hypothetical protein
LRQTADGLAVDIHRVQEQALLLVPIVELPRLSEVLAHRLHPPSEPAHRVEHPRLLEVARDLMAIVHRRDIPHRGVEERRQLVLLAANGHRRQDLIKIQIRETPGLLRPHDIRAGLGPGKQDAMELQSRPGAWAITAHHQLPPIRFTAEAISHNRRFRRASSPRDIIPAAGGAGASHRSMRLGDKPLANLDEHGGIVCSGR